MKNGYATEIALGRRDLQDDKRCKYDELPPVQLLEKLKLDRSLADRDELDRAEFFWAHRPAFPTSDQFDCLAPGGSSAISP